MAVHYRTKGFFIKKTDRGEANQLFTIYTEDFGKLEILGKAIRKIKSKLRAGAQLFYLTEIEFIQGKTHKTLTDANLIKNFPAIRKDLKKLAVAYQVAEALNSLVRGEESDKEIWNLLNEVFEKLNDWQSEIPYYYFLWNLFSILGYQPELYRCSACQKKLAPGISYFDLEAGGVICKNCFKESKNVEEINEDVVKILRLFLNRDWPILARLNISSDSQKLLKGISESYLVNCGVITKSKANGWYEILGKN